MEDFNVVICCSITIFGVSWPGVKWVLVNSLTLNSPGDNPQWPQWRRQGGGATGARAPAVKPCARLCPGSWATVMLTINESVGSDCNILFRRRQLWCYQSRWIVFSWAWPIYDGCLATRSLAARCLAKSLKVIENGTIHRSHTSSYSSSIANYHGHICIFYPSFSSVTLDTITHATTLHYRPTSIPVLPKWSEILVETRQFLITHLPLNLNVDI